MDVVCIGAANVDLIARVDRFPDADEEVRVNDFKIAAGGSAANVAVGVARLGHSSGFVGIVGTDKFGEYLISEFEKENVDISHMVKIDGVSGVVYAAICGSGRNMFAYNGSAMKFNKSLIPKDYIRNAKILHLTSIIGENVIEAFEYASSIAKKAGVKVILDPGCIFAELGADKLNGILKNCYAVLPSCVEAKMLTGLKDEKAGRKLLEYGPEVVVITKGKKGSLLVTKERAKIIETIEVDSIDTTGAGDSFAAGFITGLLEKKDLEDAVRFANRIGALSTLKRGARGTPRREEL